ncbi:MAG: RNA polymerase subunit sigma [Phycisphaeraceae bacterium]|nr:MAG: RNA polymerase subunit sigma [Phycisphaeraceae bacterium]
MHSSGSQDRLTRIIDQATGGDRAAADTLLREVYGELHRLAHARLASGPPGRTLQTTALVHEAYVRLVGREPEGYANRAHFFFAAARAMRDILVEDARRKAGPKAGGGRSRVDLDAASFALDTPPETLLALHEVLTRLESEEPEHHRMVMLRFFAGLTIEQAAEAMGLPLRTFERTWRFVRAGLRARLMGDAPGGAADAG